MVHRRAFWFYLRFDLVFSVAGVGLHKMKAQNSPDGRKRRPICVEPTRPRT